MIEFIFEHYKAPYFYFELLTWFQFSLILLVVSLVFITVSRFHLFSKHVEGRYLGYRMFLYLLTIIIVIAFILVRPFVHFALLIVTFGFLYKSIFSYSKVLFSLYYSKISFDDTIKIGDVTGTLKGVNFGGLHLLSNGCTVYFPFNMWKENKIILESESGTILLSLDCVDDLDRNEHHSINDLEKSLFNYPFLATTNVNVNKEDDIYKVAVRLSHSKYKGGLLNHIGKAGFRINGKIK